MSDPKSGPNNPLRFLVWMSLAEEALNPNPPPGGCMGKFQLMLFRVDPIILTPLPGGVWENSYSGITSQDE